MYRRVRKWREDGRQDDVRRHAVSSGRLRAARRPSRTNSRQNPLEPLPRVCPTLDVQHFARPQSSSTTHPAHAPQLVPATRISCLTAPLPAALASSPIFKPAEWPAAERPVPAISAPDRPARASTPTAPALSAVLTPTTLLPVRPAWAPRAPRSQTPRKLHGLVWCSGLEGCRLSAACGAASRPATPALEAVASPSSPGEERCCCCSIRSPA